MSRRFPAKVLATVAALATAGLAAVGLGAAPAYAADPEFTLGGPSGVVLRPYPNPTGGTRHAETVDFTVLNPSTDAAGAFPGAYTVTFDLAGLAHVADVTFDRVAGGPECTLTGTTGVCTGTGVGPGRSTVARLKITAAEDSQPSYSGTLKVSGAAQGATFTPFSTKVTVGAADLVMRPLNLKSGMKPGETQPAAVAFANKGTVPADGVRLTLRPTHGLQIRERFSNCEYREAELDDIHSLPMAGYSAMTCTFPGLYEPGAVYVLSEPLTLKAAGHAYREHFVYSIVEHTPAHSASSQGTGRALTLTKRTAAALGEDLEPSDNVRDETIQVRNTADFTVYGADVAHAAVGEKVKAEIGFRNKGPAWIGNQRTDESAGVVDVTVPEGAKVTGKPAECDAVSASGEPLTNPLGAPRYLCPLASIVREDADKPLPFELTIEKVVKGAAGTVTVRGALPAKPELPFDPDATNNTAKIVLNGKGDTAPSPTPSPTPTATPSGTATTSGTSGTAGTTTTTTSVTTQGALASTGTSVALAAAGTLLALAAGAIVIAVSRRRASR
ncbi:peptidase [Streptomyces purpureus]|uniref:peptidase n=1 Tax=Streptomyces purpureus TaxID=1951 RepID=UPI003788841D